MFAVSGLRCNQKSGGICCKGQQGLAGSVGWIGVLILVCQGYNPDEAVWEGGYRFCLRVREC